MNPVGYVFQHCSRAGCRRTVLGGFWLIVLLLAHRGFGQTCPAANCTDQDACCIEGCTGGIGAPFIVGPQPNLVGPNQLQYCGAAAGQTSIRIEANFGSPAVGNELRLYDAPTGGAPIATAIGGGFVLSVATPTGTSPFTYTYYVESRRSDNCRSRRTPVTVVVEPPLPDDLNLLAPSAVCAGDTVTLRLEGSVPTSARVDWDLTAANALLISGGSSLEAIPQATSTFRVRISTPACSTSLARTVALNPQPQIFGLSNINYCAGGPRVPLLGVPTGGTFSGLGITLDNSSSPGQYYFNPLPPGGTFPISYEVNGCAVSRFVTVVPQPSAAARINGPAQRCSGDTLRLEADSLTNASYTWRGPGGFLSTDQNPEIRNLTPSRSGAYALRIDIPGCASVSDTVEVQVSAPPQLTASSNSPVCLDGNPRTLRLLASDHPEATYSWSGPDAFSATNRQAELLNPTPAAAGTYSVTATVPGCPSVTAATDVEMLEKPMMDSVRTNAPVCVGESLTLTAPEVPGATYRWTGPAGFEASVMTGTLPRVSEAQGGTYSLEITWNPACAPERRTVTASVNPAPVPPELNALSPVCAEQEDLLLSVTPSPEGSYSWRGPNLSDTTTQQPRLQVAGVTTASDGVYTVSVTTPGCPAAEAAARVEVFERPDSLPLTWPRAVCAGAPFSIIPPVVPDAGYRWTAPDGTTTDTRVYRNSAATALDAGFYRLELDIPGCGLLTIDTLEVQVETPLPPAAITGPKGTVCAGEPVNLAANRLSGAAYTWFGPGVARADTSAHTLSFDSVTVRDAGVYTVEISRGACPPQRATFTVDVTERQMVMAGSNSPVCEGSLLRLTATEVAGASYSWILPDASTETTRQLNVQDAAPDDGGTYFLDVAFPGCPTQTIPVEVEVLALPDDLTLDVPDGPFCSDQRIELRATPVPGAEYRWMGPSGFSRVDSVPFLTLDSLTSAQSGTYLLEVSVNGCGPVVRQATLEINQLPELQLTANTPVCAGESLVLQINEVTGVDYRWTTPEGAERTGTEIRIASASTEDAGTYSVRAEVPGCGVSRLDTLVEVRELPTELRISGPTAPVCRGTAVNFFVSGNAPLPAGAEFQWRGPNGLDTTSTFSFLSLTDVQPENAGVYEVSVRVPGCDPISGRTELQVNNSVAVTMDVDTSFCAGEDLTATAQPLPGATYTWTLPNGTRVPGRVLTVAELQPSDAGRYVLEVDLPGCATATADTVIEVVDLPDRVEVQPSSALVCLGNTISFRTVDIPGATYRWLVPGGIDTTTTVGLLTVEDVQSRNAGPVLLQVQAGSCPPVTGQSVLEIGEPPVVDITGDSAYCTGERLTLQATSVPGATYRWTQPDAGQQDGRTLRVAPLTLTDAGLYAVEVEVAGCPSVSAEVVVEVNETPDAISLSGPAGAVCAGTASVTLEVSPALSGLDYNWSGPGDFAEMTTLPRLRLNNITPEDAGTYEVQLSAGTCPGLVAEYTLDVVEPDSIQAGSNEGPFCVGDALQLSATELQGANYRWSGPAGFQASGRAPLRQPLTAAHAGTYAVIIASPGCPQVTRTVAVSVNAPPVLPLNVGNNGPICAGQSTALELSVDNTPGAFYAWSGPAGFSATTPSIVITNPTAEQSGTYSVTVSVPGCTTLTGTTRAQVNTLPDLPRIQANTPICVGQTLELGLQPAAGEGILWTGPEGFTAMGAMVTRPGMRLSWSGRYTASVSVPGCPTVSVDTVIRASQEVAPGEITLSDVEACEGQDLQLTAPIVPNAEYAWLGPDWESGERTPLLTDLTPEASGTYTLVVSPGGCTQVATVFDLTVVEKPDNVTASAEAVSLCPGEALSLFGTDVPDATYRWAGPAGYRSSQRNPVPFPVTTASSGLYSLIWTLAPCPAETTTVAVEVGTPPAVPALTATPNPVCTGDDVVLEAASPQLDAEVITYAWTLPDERLVRGATAQLSGVTTAEEGLYRAVAIAQGCTSAPASLNVTVRPRPAPVEARGGVYCAGGPAELRVNNPQPGVIYRWSRPDDADRFGAVIDLTPATETLSGTYTVRAALGDGQCESLPVEVDLEVLPLPSVSFTAAAVDTVCAGATLSLSLEFEGGTGPWRLRYNINGLTQPELEFRNPTAELVFPQGLQRTTFFQLESVAYAGGPGCRGQASNTTVVRRVVAPAPTPPAVESPVEACASAGSVTLTAGAVPHASSYVWFRNGDVVGQERTLSVPATTSSSGFYGAAVVVNGCTSEVAEVEVLVRPLNEGIEAIMGDTATIRFPVVNPTTAPTALEYRPVGSDGWERVSIPPGSEEVILPELANGTYEYRFRVLNQYSCLNTFTIDRAGNSNGGDNGGGNGGGNGGNDNGNCETPSRLRARLTGDPTTAVISWSGGTTGVRRYEISWGIEGNSQSWATLYLPPSTRSITLSRLIPNRDYVAYVYAFCSTGVRLESVPVFFETRVSSFREADEAADVPAGMQVQVYPNPASTRVFVEVETSQAGSARLRMRDLAGREVLRTERRLEAGRQSWPLDVEAVRPGVYLLQIEQAGQVQNVKLVIRR